MMSIDITLKSIEEIHQFVSIVSKVDYDVDLCSGRYQVNAKSIMGVCSLDLSKPVTVMVHTNQNQQLISELKPYCI